MIFTRSVLPTNSIGIDYSVLFFLFRPSHFINNYHQIDLKVRQKNITHTTVNQRTG